MNKYALISLSLLVGATTANYGYADNMKKSDDMKMTTKASSTMSSKAMSSNGMSANAMMSNKNMVMGQASKMKMMSDKTSMQVQPNKVLDEIAYNIEVKGMSADNAFKLALQNPQRPMKERLKDIDRKPVEVIEFAGIKPGMRVLNLLSYYGYYAEVLAYRLGNEGRVLAHNTPKYKSTIKNIESRLIESKIGNITPFVSKLVDISLDKPVDTIMFMSSYHDFYGYLEKDKNQRIEILRNLKKSLKPGGHIIVSDMVEKPGKHDPKIHRIHQQLVLDEFTAAGYEVIAQSDMLRKPMLDDHSTKGYDKKRFYTDRWLMKLAPQS